MAVQTETRAAGIVRPRMAETGANPRRILGLLLTYAILIFVGLLIVLPFLWMLSTSFKPQSQWFSSQIYWIPKTFTWDNYTRIFSNTSTPMTRWFINSIGVGTAVTLLTLAIDAPAAYAYARMDFRGRQMLFGLLLGTLFLPGLMFLIPNFLTIYHLGFLNTYQGLILPGLAGVFGVFFLRQFFSGIPRELEEAAVIDGASPFQVFYLVALPLARPALATLAIITFLASWNDFLWPLLILQKADLLTLPPGLRTLQGAYTSEYGPMMAGAVIAAVPVLLLYVALQRYIVQSVATTGLKG